MPQHLATQFFSQLCIPPPALSGTSFAATRKSELTILTCLGVGTYAVLLLFSVVYYLERTAFVDISFHLFSLITTDTWAIQNFRFGALFTQAMPLMGIKLGLSLQTLAILYSVSFPVLYLSIFLIVVRVLHQPRLGLLLLAYNTVMVTDTFYWIQSELSQGVAFLILYVALIFHQDQNPEKQSHIFWSSLHPLLLLMLVFFHPLMLFVFCFLWIYFWIIRAANRKMLVSSGIAFGGMYLIKILFFRTPYDAQSMGAFQNLFDLFPHYGSLPSFQAFFHDLVMDYYLLIAGLVCFLIWGILRRKWLTIAWVICWVTGYTLLVNTSYPNHPVKFYSENLLLPLSLFIITPLIFQVLPSRLPGVGWLALSVVLLIRLVHIQQSHTLYTERLDWMRTFMEEALHTGPLKLIVDDAAVPMDALLMTWASPYEFWLLSALETGNTASIVITDRPQETEWAAGKGDVFISKWGGFPYDELPARYFHFQDDSPYQFIHKE